MKKSIILALLALGAMDAAPVADGTSSSNTEGSTAQAADANTQSTGTESSRWLQLDTLSFSMRYRSTANTVGVHMFEFGQHRELAEGRFKLDREGKYAIRFHASSGRYFNWAYADLIGGQFNDRVPPTVALLPLKVLLPIIHSVRVDPDGPSYFNGISSRGGYIYLRQLYFSATPVRPVTFEYGSLPIERGVNTEITSFDEDGYIAGARLRVHSPDHLFFDEIDGTWAYLGDALTPNFFARGQRLGEVNYQQYLVKKKLNSRILASTDYTRVRGTNTFREALKASVPELRWIDSTRGEFYQRTNDVSFYGVPAPAGSGLSASVSKAVKKVQMELGFASIDSHYSAYSGSPFLQAIGFSWNSDSFVNGNHAYARVNWKVAPGLSFSGFYNHLTSPVVYSVDHQNINGGFTFDMAELLHGHHLF